MESNKPPFHDFAPSWLKLSTPSTNGISTSEKSNIFNESTNEFDLRPQYLKKELNHTESKGNGKSGGNNRLIKEINPKASYLTNRYQFDYESNDLRKYSSLNGNEINPLNNFNINNNSINSNNSINNNRKYSTRLKNGDQLRRPNSRSEFREDGNPFFHLKNHLQHGNKSKLNPASETYSCLDEKSLSSSKLKSNLKLNGIGNSSTFKEEFPSLVDETVINMDTNSGNNVWDNVKKKVLTTAFKKVNLLPRPVCFSDSSNHFAENCKGYEENALIFGSNFYRNVVPVVPKKRSTNGQNGSHGKDNSSLANSLSNLSLGQNTKILPVFTKSRDHSSSSQSMEILVKKHPKMRRDKNEFLKTLRSSSHDSRAEQEEHCEEKESNVSQSSVEMEEKKLEPEKSTKNEVLKKEGREELDEEEEDEVEDDEVEDEEDEEEENEDRRRSEREDCAKAEGSKIEQAKVVEEKEIKDAEEDSINVLSSSLEAEERLLRQMGWKEEEEDDKIYAPLTEDEVNEFKDLIKSSRHENVKRSINLNQPFQFILSPRKIVSPFNCLNKSMNGVLSAATKAEEENSDLSSDEDDDSDADP